MKFGTDLSLRRQVEEEYATNDDNAIEQAYKAYKEIEDDKTKKKTRKKKKVDKE